jgi:hypothetical protein
MRRPSLFEPIPDREGPEMMPWLNSPRRVEEEVTSEMENMEIRKALASRRASEVKPSRTVFDRMKDESLQKQKGIPSIDSSETENMMAGEARRDSSSPKGGRETSNLDKAVPTQLIERVVEKEIVQQQVTIEPPKKSEPRSKTQAGVLPLVHFRTRSEVASVIKQDQTGAIRMSRAVDQKREGEAAPDKKPHKSAEARVRRDVFQKREKKGAGPRPAKPETPPVLHPLPRPAYSTSRSQSVVSQETLPPAPTIQISIGRIEVRAASLGPVPPDRAARPKGPKLSLEDYLRSRSGGTK